MSNYITDVLNKRFGNVVKFVSVANSNGYTDITRWSVYQWGKRGCIPDKYIFLIRDIADIDTVYLLWPNLDRRYIQSVLIDK